MPNPRFRGALLGLAAGDALGTTLEFKPRDSCRLVDDMVGGGPFRLRPGEWTDDTSMALCLAESLIEARGFDAFDQMERYCLWRREGHLSSTGKCFDIGNTIASALDRFEERRRTEPELPREVLAFCGSKESVLEYDWRWEPLAEKIEAIARGSYREKERRMIESSGYVVHTLEAALWAFHHGADFREGALLAVNLGGDADTTGAVYGQLAGAFYGEEGIPADWRAKLAMRELIEEFADKLQER